MAESFRLRTSPSEGGSAVQTFVVSAAVAIGDLVKINRSNGQVAPLTTGAAGLAVGLVVAPADYNTKMSALVNGTSKVRVAVDPENVYAIDDANARHNGATLDISGGTGAQALAASSNKDFVVVAESSATQETLVKINPAMHYAEAM